MARLRSGCSDRTAPVARPVEPGDDVCRTSFRHRHYPHKRVESCLDPGDRQERRSCPSLPIGRNGPWRSEKLWLERQRDQKPATPYFALKKDYTSDDTHDSLVYTLASGSTEPISYMAGQLWPRTNQITRPE